MNVIHRYTNALQSSNLRDDARHHQTNVLAAVALSGSLGSKLFRVKYGSTESCIRVNYADLLRDWFAIVQAKSVRREWPSFVSASAVARSSLDHWLDDVCEACGGRAHLPLADVPNVLHDEDCAACNGTGKKPLRADGRQLRYVTDMVELLESMTAGAGAEAAKRLAEPAGMR